MLSLSEYEYRFAEYEYEYEYDFARSIDARCGIHWQGYGPDKDDSLRSPDLVADRFAPRPRVIGRPFRWPDSHARNFSRSKCCAVACGRVSWRCGSRTPGEPECRFKQHDSGTIGSTLLSEHRGTYFVWFLGRAGSRSAVRGRRHSAQLDELALQGCGVGVED